MPSDIPPGVSPILLLSENRFSGACHPSRFSLLSTVTHGSPPLTLHSSLLPYFRGWRSPQLLLFLLKKIPFPHASKLYRYENIDGSLFTSYYCHLRFGCGPDENSQYEALVKVITRTKNTTRRLWLWVGIEKCYVSELSSFHALSRFSVLASIRAVCFSDQRDGQFQCSCIVWAHSIRWAGNMCYVRTILRPFHHRSPWMSTIVIILSL